jgi:hypothetical protein
VAGNIGKFYYFALEANEVFIRFVSSRRSGGVAAMSEDDGDVLLKRHLELDSRGGRGVGIRAV